MRKLLLLTALLGRTAAGESCDVRQHGARGDGKTLDTAAIQKAIDACAVVNVPPGSYLTGSIQLRSRIRLHLAPGALLLASTSMQDYPVPHLLFARDAEEITIDGPGGIDGQGPSFWDANFRPLPRPSPLLSFQNCRSVRLRDLHIRNAPGWTIHPKNCDGVWIDRIRIDNDRRGPNTDGIDPDSSRNVFISNSYISAGDDAIVLKTTRDASGTASACENIFIENCVLASDDSAIKLGTESHGPIRHVRVSNTVVRDSWIGVAIFAKDGGTFEDIVFSNLAIETTAAAARGRLTWPVFIDIEPRTPDSPVSRVRDIAFRSLHIASAGRVYVSGAAQYPVENLVFAEATYRVTGSEKVEGGRKPRGSASLRHPPIDDLASVPALFILHRVKDASLERIRIRSEGQSLPSGGVLFRRESSGIRISAVGVVNER